MISNIFSKSLDCDYYNDKALVQKFASDIIAKQISQILNGGASVLDVGCGTGFLVKDLSKDFKVTGLDISEKMIKFCKQNYQDASFVLKKSNWLDTELSELPHYNAVVSNFMFQWVKDFYQKIPQIMQKTDHFIFSIPLLETYQNIPQNIVKTFLDLESKDEFETKINALDFDSKIKFYDYSESYLSLFDFLKHLKKIGTTDFISTSTCYKNIKKTLLQGNFEVNYKFAICEIYKKH